MNKALQYLGGLFLMILMGMVVLLIWAQRSGSAHQEKFFTAVLSGDPQQVLAQFHPALRNEVDAPVLQVWMKEFSSRLGRFRGLSATKFNTSTRLENGVRLTVSTGTVEFEKGVAGSELTFADDQIVKFNVQSKSLPDDWFKGPIATELYRDRARTLLEHLLNSRVKEAHQMMHPALQKEIPLTSLESGIQNLMRQFGSVRELKFAGEKLNSAENFALEQLFDVITESGMLSGSIKFRFDGLKGHILAFNLQPASTQ